MTTAALAVLVLAAGCGRIDFDPGGDPFVAGAHRKLISIHSPVASTLEAFPVSIVLDQDPDLARAALADGSDLVFTSLDGAILPSELVAYDAGDVEAWVAIPTLIGDATTSIYLYYGGPSTTRESPWSSLFAGVWHMNLVGGTALDSAGGHPASTVATEPSGVAAAVGLGAEFDGVEDALSAGDPADGSLDFGTRSFAYSIWVQAGAPVGEYDTPLRKGGSAPQTPGYDFELGTGPWHAFVSDGTNQISGNVGSEAELTGTWAHLAFVVDRPGQDFRSFANGEMRGSQFLSGFGSVDSTNGLTFSRPPTLPQPYRGVLDEVRVYRDAVSNDWIAAEYANIAARADMITIGPAE